MQQMLQKPITGRLLPRGRPSWGGTVGFRLPKASTTPQSADGLSNSRSAPNLAPVFSSGSSKALGESLSNTGVSQYIATAKEADAAAAEKEWYLTLKS